MVDQDQAPDKGMPMRSKTTIEKKLESQVAGRNRGEHRSESPTPSLVLNKI